MLEQTLVNFLARQGLERHYWLAYSGGLDSRVLLELCIKLRRETPFTLTVVHIHHGLSPLADQWLAEAEALCAHHQVAFQSARIQAQAPAGESVEAYARQLRYEKLQEFLGAGDFLLTAHHQDDQAESLLLQLLRGAGPKGLSAMPEVKPFGVGFQGRPLLAHTRAELETYAVKAKLQWINDEMNLDPRYSRNYLRHEIFPLLKKQWPSLSATLARSAELCAETQNLLEDFAAENLKDLQGSQPQTLAVSRLLQLAPARQRLLLRFWFEQQKAALPSAVKLEEILKSVLSAANDRQPLVAWGGVELRRFQDELYLLPGFEPHHQQKRYTWQLSQPLTIPGIGDLQASLAQGGGLQMQFTEVEIRFRQGGEVFQLAQGQHHELKKFFQEQGIAPWLRERLPLIYVADELAAIPGLLVVSKFKAAPEERGYELRFSAA